MILITGCAGYIGSELCKKLEKSNINYVGIDSLKYSYSENIYNKKKFIKSCISNKRLLLNLIKKFKVNTIIHCAAYAYVNDAEIHKKKYYLNNVLKTQKFIDLIVKEKIQNFIFLSSSNVYSENIKNNYFSESSKTKPKNYYGKTKLIIEKYLLSKKKFFKNIYILRLFNIIGLTKKFKPKKFHQFKHQRFFFKIYYMIKKNEPMFLNYIDRKNKTRIYPSRDFLDIRDFSNIILFILKNLNKKFIKIYNAGCGKSYALNKILNLMKSSENFNFKLKYTKLPKKEYILTRASIKKINSELKWKPKFLILDSIKSLKKNLII